MDELNQHFNQLPDFLRAEIFHHAGNVDGQSQLSKLERYINAAHYLMVSKRAPLRQDHIDNIAFLWGDSRSSKHDMENRASLRNMPGGGQTDFFSMTIEADFHLQSIRFLSECKIRLESMHARLKEQERQHAKRLAQEAAQRETEAAARAKAEAEENARRIAQEQAAQQLAREAALQLALRQIEEAERALAHRLAEETRAREAESRHEVQITLGPDALRDVDGATKVLKDSIEIAVMGFSDAIGAHGAFDVRQLEAIRNMNAIR